MPARRHRRVSHRRRLDAHQKHLAHLAHVKHLAERKSRTSRHRRRVTRHHLKISHRRVKLRHRGRSVSIAAMKKQFQSIAKYNIQMDMAYAQKAGR